ncbi:MAG: SAM-dependent methyltransferase [Verrucomicrobia bacterium]|nr:MAG: SAM-dependent methyltransferase [Verrucomicrobiota bacterium]
MISRIKRKISGTLQALRGKGNHGNHGYCSICEHPVYFEIEGPWLRDQYRCVNCKSIPRWRALMSVVAELYPRWRELKIHESSPGGPLSDKLARECPEYLPSHFFPDAPRGQIHGGFRCEDLMAQTFKDGSFDLVITSDVFEHLPDVRLAVGEIMRTLRPGGAHIFTVPWYRTKKTLIRALVKDGVLQHLEKPDYHGNPIDENGSLVFTEWGAELPFLLQQWGQFPVIIHTIRDRALGIDGEFREVFVQQKSYR